MDLKADCQTFEEQGDGGGKIVYHIQDWKDFFLPYFQEKLAEGRSGGSLDDQYVPPTFAPHILMDVFIECFKKKFPQAMVETESAESLLGTPMEMTLANKTRALSFATWMCPASCIEPPTCPHTRGPKDWDMKDYLETHPRIDVKSLFLFRCRHFAMGVGTIPMREIVEEYLSFEKAASQPGAHHFMMASISSCHALIGQVKVRNA